MAGPTHVFWSTASPLNVSSIVGGGGSTFEDTYGTSIPEGASVPVGGNVSQGTISGSSQGTSTSAAPGGGEGQAPPTSSFQEAESLSQAPGQFDPRSHNQAAARSDGTNQQAMVQELQQQQSVQQQR